MWDYYSGYGFCSPSVAFIKFAGRIAKRQEQTTLLMLQISRSFPARSAKDPLWRPTMSHGLFRFWHSAVLKKKRKKNYKRKKKSTTDHDVQKLAGQLHRQGFNSGKSCRSINNSIFADYEEPISGRLLFMLHKSRKQLLRAALTNPKMIDSDNSDDYCETKLTLKWHNSGIKFFFLDHMWSLTRNLEY